MSKVELLAPAGSVEVMKACYHAGADAVYMGLSVFSARAYADNADTDVYTEAIHYAHLHGKKLYLTLNTLLKERELTEKVYDLLKPLYEAGLDGVIMQDIGAMAFVQKHFPDLPIHVSTQCTVTGPESAAFYRQFGATRVVPARELSLSEIREIREETGLEVECFIHGALCYSYSGQCLFSSIVGGRSGNRGRCAQPCRMSYDVVDERTGKVRHDVYCLSMKDLCTIDSLPELIEAGACSLKIEGRMKKAEYAAGVTSIYRKYLDLYEKKGKEVYKVDPKDRQALLDLFNRQGFTDGYLKRQNDASMITMKEVPFREENEALTRLIRERYIDSELKTEISGEYKITIGESRLKLSARIDGREFSYTAVSDSLAQAATQRAADRENVEKQLSKLGNTEFVFKSLHGELSDGLFLPVSALNAFRRDAVEGFREEILKAYRRTLPENEKETAGGHAAKLIGTPGKSENLMLSVYVRSDEQFSAALSEEGVGLIYLSSAAFSKAGFQEKVKAAHEKQKEIYLAFPQIMRMKAREYFRDSLDEIRAAGFDGFLVPNTESLSFVEKEALHGKIVSDHTLYAFNKDAGRLLLENGIDRMTLPVELNRQDIRENEAENAEMIVYGRLPMMVSANCIHRTCGKCDHYDGFLTLIDRKKNEMPVKSDCRFCLNTIYNAKALSLIDERRVIGELGLASVRLEFTTEDAVETKKVISAYADAFLRGKDVSDPVSDHTKGHFRRGVE